MFEGLTLGVCLVSCLARCQVEGFEDFQEGDVIECYSMD